MKIVLTIPFYYCKHEPRYEITRKIFVHYTKIKERLSREGIQMELLLVGSEGKLSRDLALKFVPKENYIEHKQESEFSYQTDMLSRKFKRCVIEAKKFDPDIVLLCGSNDMITYKFFTSLKEYVKDHIFFGIGGGNQGGCYFFNTYNDNSFYWDGLYNKGLERKKTGKVSLTNAQRRNRITKYSMPDLPSEPPVRRWVDTQMCAGILGWKRSYLDKINWQVNFGLGGNEMVAERQARKLGKVAPIMMMEEQFQFWSIKYDNPKDKQNCSEINRFTRLKRKWKGRSVNRLTIQKFLQYYNSL